MNCHMYHFVTLKIAHCSEWLEEKPDLRMHSDCMPLQVRLARQERVVDP